MCLLCTASFPLQVLLEVASGSDAAYFSALADAYHGSAMARAVNTECAVLAEAEADGTNHQRTNSCAFFWLEIFARYGVLSSPCARRCMSI